MTLVDASSWIEFLRSRTSEPGQRVRDLLAAGHAAWCEITRVELWNGARGAREKAALTQLEQELTLYSIHTPVWEKACELARCCRKAGVNVPTPDLLVAACARHYHLDVEHCDRHLDRILPIAAKL